MPAEAARGPQSSHIIEELDPVAIERCPRNPEKTPTQDNTPTQILFTPLICLSLYRQVIPAYTGGAFCVKQTSLLAETPHKPSHHTPNCLLQILAATSKPARVRVFSDFATRLLDA
jgi:hypothetical protein